MTKLKRMSCEFEVYVTARELDRNAAERNCRGGDIQLAAERHLSPTEIPL